MTNIFNEHKDIPNTAKSVFSWRKAGTALIFITFAYACIGYLHKHNFDELPTSYMITIGSVFAFYFGKNVIENIKLTTKS